MCLSSLHNVQKDTHLKINRTFETRLPKLPQFIHIVNRFYLESGYFCKSIPESCYISTHYSSGKYRFNAQVICAHRSYLQDEGYSESYSEFFLLELLQQLWIPIHELQKDSCSLIASSVNVSTVAPGCLPVAKEKLEDHESWTWIHKYFSSLCLTSIIFN